MKRIVLTRLAASLSAIIGASLLSFVLLRIAPGDPVGLVLGPFATAEARMRLTEELGLHAPIYRQYLVYVGELVKGDWGYSYSAGQPVRELMVSRLSASLELSLFSLFFALVFAFMLALLRSHFRRAWRKKCIDFVSFVGYSIPQFWLGLLVLIVFSGAGIFPGPEGRLSPNLDVPPRVTGFYTIDALVAGQPATLLNALWHLVLPSFALGFFTMAFLTRILQTNLEHSNGQMFVRISLSRGLSRWGALVRHSLPNSLVTSSTAAGVIAGIIITGSALVEKTFDWPGIGALVTESVQKQDFSVVQAFIFFSAVVFVLVNLIVDLVVARIDPRIRGLTG
jgi:ABC-type dipeptide/oligopeptide/nickel transport system permease component